MIPPGMLRLEWVLRGVLVDVVFVVAAVLIRIECEATDWPSHKRDGR